MNILSHPLAVALLSPHSTAANFAALAGMPMSRNELVQVHQAIEHYSLKMADDARGALVKGLAKAGPFSWSV